MKNKPYDKDIDKHLGEGIEMGALFLILSVLLVGLCMWALFHMASVMEVVPWTK